MRKPITEETREKMRIAALNRSPEAEARRIGAVRRVKQTPGHREHCAAGARKRYQDPKERQLQSERRRAYLATPKGKAQHAKAMKRAGEAMQGVPRGALGLVGSPEYKVWSAMVQRCTNPRANRFKDYGGRGIGVASEWQSRGGFARFYEHLGPRPSNDHSVGRIDNDGDYEPGNVRWETWLEQMANTRRSHTITIGGVTKHLAQWAREAGITPPTLAGRIERGWPEDRWLEPSTGRGRPRRQV